MKKPKTTIEPVSPDEIVDQKEQDFPPEVIEVFNKLIAKYWKNGESVFTTVVARKEVASALRKAKIPFDSNYLDVEDIYRKNGWKVEYDAPGYNENYEAFFKFTRPD